VLQSVTPADGSTVADAREVRLAFSGELREGLSALVVTGPDGTDVADGPPTSSGGTVVQPLRGPLPDGRWTVAYRVVAADGHPVTGTSTFVLEGQALPAAGSAPQEPAPPAPQDGSEAAAALAPASAPPSRGAGGPAVLLLVAAALVGGGLLVARRRSARSAGVRHASGRLSST
jgi:copper resistance protein C